MPPDPDWIPLLQAFRLCGWRSRQTALNYAARGILRIRRDAHGRRVSVRNLLAARTLLIGRFALCTGVTRRRIRRELRAGRVSAAAPWPGATARFRLRDVVPFRERIRAEGHGQTRLNDAGERRLAWLRARARD